MIKTLFLSSNPEHTLPLLLDEEIRAITEKIRSSDYRDAIELTSLWAVRPDDLLQALNVHKPTIVHFSGHGSSAGEIILMDDFREAKPVSAVAIKMLFTTLKDNVRLVVLNACYSEIQALAISEVIDCVIGMNSAIGDNAAIVFAASLYRAIGFGRSVKEAFEQGITALMLQGIPEDNTPQLLVRPGVNPSSVILIDQSSNLTIQTPKISPVKDHCGCGVSAVSKEDRPRVFWVNGTSPTEGAELLFDITNPNEMEMRIDEIEVNVIEYQSAYFLDVMPYAGTGTTRRYSCTVAASVGSYKCKQMSKDYDYVKLSFGELEHFGINVYAQTAGIYTMRVNVRYSLAGQMRDIASDTISIGFFSSIVQRERHNRFDDLFSLHSKHSDAVAVLTMALHDQDIENRQKAAIELGKMGNHVSIPELIRALKNSRSWIRKNAAELLGKLGSVDAVSALAEALNDEDRWAKQYAAEALGKIGDPGGIPALREHLGDKQIAREVAKSLGQIGVQSLAILGDALDSEDAQIRQEATSALEYIGTDAMPLAKKALGDKDSWVRLRATSVLGKIGSSEAARELLNALEDENERVRQNAADQLGVIRNPIAVPALRQALNKQNTGAAFALARVTPPDIIGLEDALKHENWRVRESATAALGQAGYTLAALAHREKLSKEDEATRESINNLLSQMLNDESERVRKIAREKLLEIDRWKKS